MARPRKPTAEEIAEFQRSVGPVRKLRHDKTGPVRRPPPPRPRAPVEPDKYGSFDSLSDNIADEPVNADDSLFFARPGLQQRQLQRLKRGQLAAGAELDLHGMTAAVARRALGEFITLCLDKRIRSVHIIHGKGYGATGKAPVLKNRLNAWLRQHHDVLAFSSARLRDGGTGALYVLLRSQRDRG
jgi:DNA-nicking Smr family endonuclease